jgi:hypothetical protein
MANLTGDFISNYGKLNTDKVGTALLPAITVGGDANSGLYGGTDEVNISAAGSLVAAVTTAGLAVTGTLSSTGALTSTGTVIGTTGVYVGPSATGGLIFYEDSIITSTQVLALFTTPIAIIAAGASGSYRRFLGAYLFLDYTTTQYAATGGYDVVVQKASAGDVVSNAIDSTMFTAAADALVRANPLSDTDASAVDDLTVDAGYEVTILNGNWTNGVSPLKIRAYYEETLKATFEAIA